MPLHLAPGKVANVPMCSFQRELRALPLQREENTSTCAGRLKRDTGMCVHKGRGGGALTN